MIKHKRGSTYLQVVRKIFNSPCVEVLFPFLSLSLPPFHWRCEQHTWLMYYADPTLLTIPLFKKLSWLLAILSTPLHQV